MNTKLTPLKFEELKSLDLRQCDTVGDLVDGLRYCAFGARMLGEVAATLREMISAGEAPLLIFDGLTDSPLGELLQRFVANGWCRKLLQPGDYAKSRSSNSSRATSIATPL